LLLHNILSIATIGILEYTSEKHGLTLQKTDLVKSDDQTQDEGDNIDDDTDNDEPHKTVPSVIKVHYDTGQSNYNTEEANISQETQMVLIQKNKKKPEEPYPVETCFQPLDIGQEFLDTNNKIFCLAPGEGQTPQSIFQEKGSDAMAFPTLHPSGRFGFHENRTIPLSPSKYFNARLFSSDDRFAKNNQFIFLAQYLVEMHNIKSNISIALRKGETSNAEGKKITAEMLTINRKLKKDIEI